MPVNADLDEDVLKKIRRHYDPNLSKEKVDRDLGISTDKKAKYFSILPGVNHVVVNDLEIKGQGKKAEMEVSRPQPNFFFDVKSKDFRINEAFGFQFLFHTSSIAFDRQRYSQLVSGGSNSSSSSSKASGSSEESEIIHADLGTRLRVDYSYLIPTFYWGNPDVDGFRMGLGAGLADLRMRGNVDFRESWDTIGRLVFPYADTNRTDFLNGMAQLQFSSGLVDLKSGDPVFNYLLFNLSQNNNLEWMGLYLLGQGVHFSTDLLSILTYIQYKDHFSPLELLALGALSRSSINSKPKNVFAYMIFLETPKFGFVKFRFSVNGPIFNDSGFRFRMTLFELSAMIPIEF
ncbi:hypothetical protein AB3N59_14955 [Leptospira sp. WS92.C1]